VTLAESEIATPSVTLRLEGQHMSDAREIAAALGLGPSGRNIQAPPRRIYTPCKPSRAILRGNVHQRSHKPND
jgi:hypothetical protein